LSGGRKSSLAFCILLIAVTVGTLALRLPQLDRRPMHADEANQVVKTGELHDAGKYEYDPRQHHGPTLYYLTLPSLWLSGADGFAESAEPDYRLVPVVFGAALILLLLLVADGIGRSAAICAGVLTAVSPAMVFYSRFYIQEMLLVFFTFGAIAAGWRYARSRSLGWALLAGAFIGLMHATKETCVIAYAAMLVALALLALWRRRTNSQPDIQFPQLRLRDPKLLLAALVAVAVSVLFFSSFLTNASGPLDSVSAYATYAQRAGGDGLHEHPWYYYLKMLTFAEYGPGPWWSEGLIVALALVGAVAAFIGKGLGKASVPFVRFLAVYTLVATLTYSAIPYKTPWCLLGFLHGMILLAGVGSVALVRALPCRPTKATASVLLIVAACHLGWQAHRASFKFASDPRNPYVYAHTSADLLNLVKRVEELAPIHPDGDAMLVRVIASPHDTWPLPWYLRRFGRVEYWHELPENIDAPIVIVSAEYQPAIGRKLGGRYQPMHYGLRPGVLLTVYVDADLWDGFLKRQPK